MTSDLRLSGVRFPRSMLNSQANGRLLEHLGVELVDDCDAELEDFARAWLATQPPRHSVRDHSVLPSVAAVRDALERMGAVVAAGWDEYDTPREELEKEKNG